jgi:hypothetical protein
MMQSSWDAVLGEAVMSLTPIYLILQVWLGSAWKGAWRGIALAPLLVFVPASIIALIGLAEVSNLWPIAVIFFAPVGCIYFLVAGLARTMFVKRGMS